MKVEREGRRSYWLREVSESPDLNPRFLQKSPDGDYPGTVNPGTDFPGTEKPGIYIKENQEHDHDHVPGSSPSKDENKIRETYIAAAPRKRFMDLFSKAYENAYGILSYNR